MTRIDQIFTGGISPLPPEGHSTGIFKHVREGAVRLGREGLEGDVQADRRVHGGPDKALHLYPAQHYAQLSARFPHLTAALIPGSLGENLSATGWDEHNVCIGDIFRLGDCRVQVSQPRSPCWKINHKFGEEALSRYIAERGCTGWYFRVLDEGDVRAGDGFELVSRNPEPVTLARLWQTNLAHRPDPAELRSIAATSGLAPGWVKKLRERVDWLARNAEPGS